MAFAAARMIIHKEAKGNRKKSLDDANLKGDMKVTSIHIVQTVKLINPPKNQPPPLSVLVGKSLLAKLSHKAVPSAILD